MIWATYSFSNHFIQFQSTVNLLTPNLHEIIMIFSVSNDGIQWTLDFGPDSVTIAVNDLDQNITISSQEMPLAAWQLLLSQRQNFLNNHLSRVPITPNQEDEEEDKENVPPPTTPESVRPSEPPRLQRSWAFGERMENVPDYVFRNLFH